MPKLPEAVLRARPTFPLPLPPPVPLLLFPTPPLTPARFLGRSVAASRTVQPASWEVRREQLGQL